MTAATGGPEGRGRAEALAHFHRQSYAKDVAAVETLFFGEDVSNGLARPVPGQVRPVSPALAALREVDAAGFTPYAAYPALRGQRDAYLITRIGEYQDGKHTSLTTDFVMGGAAKHLDKASVEALAAWLSSLPR